MFASVNIRYLILNKRPTTSQVCGYFKVQKESVQLHPEMSIAPLTIHHSPATWTFAFN